MPNRITRRNFAQLIGLTAGAAGTATLARPARAEGVLQTPATWQTPPTQQAAAYGVFPKGFLWGTADSAYQVEGAPEADGRGLSVWDVFSRAKKTYTGENGDLADDRFHRYREDIQIMRDLGVKAYQFSVSWSRIFPQGTGQQNPKGWDFYDRMLEVVLAAGIEPWCTLYHWDLPQGLMSIGGWQSRDTAKALADYSAAAVKHLGDRVKNYITISEVTAFVDGGYRYGTDAPGLKLSDAEVNQVTHNVLLGHGLALEAVRANAKPGTRVGIADNAVSTCPVIETPENIEAAKKAYREENARSLTVMMEGRYHEHWLKAWGASAPKFTAEDLNIISAPMDFVGLNVYEPTWIRAAANESGYEAVDMPKSYPKMAAGWLQIGPEGAYWSPKFAHELWGVKEIYITENGAASLDVPVHGEILDVDRVEFLRNYLGQLHRGVSEGVPVKGYFLWTLLDDYEWSDGYAMRFGIVYVDYATQKRTVKLSGDFYKEVIRRNGLV